MNERVVEPNLVAARSQPRRGKLRKLLRVSLGARKENENEHGEPRRRSLLACMCRTSGHCFQSTAEPANAMS
jgi:hypothetical protein